MADAGATAFVVWVPEAEGLVGDLRLRHDPVAALGVPAHVTALYPFMPPARVTDEVFERAAMAVRGIAAFDFCLSQVACFVDTVYLAPQPAEPFVALTEALARTFPEYPPFGGAHPTIVPHLSVGRGTAEQVECIAAALRPVLHAHGPVQARCAELTLLQRADGRWHEMRRLPLSTHGSFSP